jgi:hypothetical protein
MGLVQEASNTAASLTSLTVTFGSGSTAGNCLAVCAGSVAGTDNPTISGITLGGSAGNFASANTAYNNNDANAAIWIDPDCAGSETSVAISWIGGSGSNPAVAAYAFEWAGVKTSSPLDKAPAGVTGSGTSWSSGSTGTLSQANEVAFGVVGGIYSSITGPGLPWTNEALITVGSNFGLIAGYQQVSATSALTYSGTASPSQLYGTCIVTLELGGVTVTSTGSLAMAPMKTAGTATETDKATGAVALAPMAMAGTATVSATVTCTGSLAMAPMALAGTGAAAGRKPIDTPYPYHHR